MLNAANGSGILRITGMIFAFALTGCAINPSTLGEEYEVSHLRVVFLDEKQIRDKWEQVTGKTAVMMTPRLVLESKRREEVVVGFYDFHTRTIYCPKMNFEVCGHELHHAVLGRFHFER